MEDETEGGSRPVGCSPFGLSGKDWAGEWLMQLYEFGLPGLDFIMLAPSVELLFQTVNC